MKLPVLNIGQLYQYFDEAVTPIDCGTKCAPNNPHGKPFCCDICYAVPAVYRQEWDFHQEETDLWHVWRGDECSHQAENPTLLEEDTPANMVLLACLGPDRCQRPYRSISCRQFPFFPYITNDFRFLGMAYEWEFEKTCWVISNLDQVTHQFRQAFINFFNDLFSNWMLEMESYALKSEQMRTHYSASRRRIPILHHNGGYYLLSPASERIERISPARLPRFGLYKNGELS